MGGGWLGGGGAARVRAGGGCAAATDGVGRCWQRSGRFFLSAPRNYLFPQLVSPKGGRLLLRLCPAAVYHP